MAANRHIILRDGQSLFRGNANLQMYQIQPGDQLGDRMLHLQTRVHLKEVKILLLVDEKLNRTGVRVTGGLRDPDGDCAHLSAHFRIDHG